MRRRWLWVMLSAAALMLSAAAGSARQRDDLVSADTVEAVWKVQLLDFAYRGYSTTYSCSGLQRRLQRILRALGANDSLTIEMRRCIDDADMARMQIRLASPVEATAENIAAVTSYDSKDVLIARIRNERLDSAGDIERFPAVWKTVSMSRDRELKLDSGDCELVQQLRRDVFPHMSIRVVHDNLRCSIVFGNLGQPQLSVAALVAVPPDR